MDVFGKGDNRPLLAPAICFICEKAPIQEAEHVIDTFRTFATHLPTALSGRKYVCGGCAEELGKAVGLVGKEEVELARTTATASHVLASELQRKVDALEAIHVDTLKELFAKATKPATGKAPKVEG